MEKVAFVTIGSKKSFKDPPSDGGSWCSCRGYYLDNICCHTLLVLHKIEAYIDPMFSLIGKEKILLRSKEGKISGVDNSSGSRYGVKGKLMH
jgi:hypothetical protein